MNVTYRQFHYRWEYEFAASPHVLWSFVADTNRFNRDAGLPAVSVEPGAGGRTDEKTARRRMRLSWRGLKVEWEEDPFEWIRPHRFGVVRRYFNGPVREMRVEAELQPRTDGGTRLVYQLWAQPRNALGFVVIPVQLRLLHARRFREAFRRYDQLARTGELPVEVSADSQLTPGGRARLSMLRAILLEQHESPELVARLVQTIEQADDLTLSRLRPYALADYWNAPRRAVLELCLHATRAGLLDFRWDLLCPLCRGPQQSASSLKDVQTNVHCDSCNIDFTANFDRSVEVTFRPNAAVRPLQVREFCVGGPQVTPHIVVQQLIEPGDARTFAPALEEGRYRLRAHNTPGGQSLFVAPDGQTEAHIHLNGKGWSSEELLIAPAPELRLANASDESKLFILERMAWSDQAATAAEVTALQIFRDLFASEALRPGDRISVGSLTILFTDLCKSTQLYREIGDAVAFGTVMSHFDVLREAIAEEEGAMVKTLGDAVMAVFRRPASALRAILKAQRALAAPPEGMRPLRVKAGIHSGPCIAVTLNGRLDYFGSNVNLAARLEPLSSGGDVIISAAVRNDPKVAALLDAPCSGLSAEPVATALKGFDAERFDLWRVRRTNDSQNRQDGETG